MTVIASLLLSSLTTEAVLSAGVLSSLTQCNVPLLSPSPGFHHRTIVGHRGNVIRVVKSKCNADNIQLRCSLQISIKNC